MDNETQTSQSNRKNLYLEYALFLILGFLLGIVIKTEAAKRITIGFNDYQINTEQEVYSINDLQKKLAEEQNQIQKQAEQLEGQENADNNNQKEQQ